jgi:dihydrolipoamide dehydrogenase
MDYDLVVIGAGPGGHAVAENASRLGARVAIVEKDKWGGVCTHCGCIPTKALLACSRGYTETRKLKRMGISTNGISADFHGMKRHQNQMVKVSSSGVRKTLEDAGVERKEGEGFILSPDEVEVVSSDDTKDHLKTKNIVIAWGSEPAVIPGIEISGRILNSRDFLALRKLPGSAIVVGGGAIGVEFATFMAELGVKVTIVELMNQILPAEEKDAAQLLTGELKKIGIDIYTSASMKSLTDTGDGVMLKLTHENQTQEIVAENALICAGRSPLLRNQELDRLSIQYDRKGIVADDCQMTNIKHVFAVGDVTGGILLAHRAMAQGRAVASNLFGDGSVKYREEIIPSVIYTHPNVARVGLTEEKALEQGLKIEVNKVEYGGNIIARTELMGKGFVKTLFSDGRLVGVTIAGDKASELIAPMSMAVANEMGKRELRNWIIPHPTLSELLCVS